MLHSITMFEILTLGNGVKSLRALDNLETFHPGMGPRREANLLHVEQQRLVERATTTLPLIIWDIGLGACANATAVIHALRGEQGQIELHSFEKTLAPVTFAMEHASDLEYPTEYLDLIRELVTKRSVKVTPHLNWVLHLGDFAETVQSPDLPAPHAILYDPYSPKSNPEMWNLNHFTHLFQRLDPQRPCLWTNYSRSTAVRVALLLAGFYVGIGVELGQKAESTVASNDLSLLTRPLDRAWLNRVQLSRNSAPQRDPKVITPGPIGSEDFERLKNCKQFAYS